MKRFDAPLSAVISSPVTVVHKARDGVASRLGSLGFRLPRLHEALLGRADGITGYGGYVRLFGLSDAVADLVSWNELDTWKFAWPSHVQDYFCFGETAWGDQYAYAAEALRGATRPAVYFLESITMQPEKIAPDFGTFLTNEFLRVCEMPYDELTVEVRKTLGDLAADEHVVFAPSPLVTGSESLEHVMKMPAWAAMVAAGDLASQVGDALQSRPIKRIQPYTDERGRTRLRVLFSDSDSEPARG